MGSGSGRSSNRRAGRDCAEMRCDVPEEKAHRLAREYVAAWNSHDADRLTRLFAEDGSYGEFGLGRIMLGQEEIRRYLIATFAALPDLTVTPTIEPLGSGERVFWKWLMTATHEGEFAGLPSTGKRFELQGASTLITRGDKIVRSSDCFDLGSLVRQVAPERKRHSDDATGPADPERTELDPWLTMLSDEDNIGYGE
jgi:steroid delta-isomerase-like uncharacterized protein